MIWVRHFFVTFLSFSFFFFLSVVQIIHNAWQRYILHVDIPLTQNVISSTYAQTLSTVEEALNSFMPEVSEFEDDIRLLSSAQQEEISTKAKITFDPIHDNQFHFKVGKVNGNIVGYAVEDVVKGKWGGIHYMIHLDPSGQVKDVIVLQYQEKRGKPIAKRRFLKQFRGKNSENKIRLRKDIKGITGASISSRGITDGIRKLVHVFEALYLMETTP